MNTPINEIHSKQDNYADYLDNKTMYEKEFIAYKTFKHIVKSRLLGPFPDNITHFDSTGKHCCNNLDINIPIQRIIIFVMMNENIDKWRDILDFRFKITNNMLINGFVYPEFVSIHYSRLQDMLTTFINCIHAFKLDWKSVFKQIRIHHCQWQYFAFDFDWYMFISSVLDFRRSDTLCEFLKCSKFLVLMVLNMYPDFLLKRWIHLKEHFQTSLELWNNLMLDCTPLVQSWQYLLTGT